MKGRLLSCSRQVLQLPKGLVKTAMIPGRGALAGSEDQQLRETIANCFKTKVPPSRHVMCSAAVAASCYATIEPAFKRHLKCLTKTEVGGSSSECWADWLVRG